MLTRPTESGGSWPCEHEEALPYVIYSPNPVHLIKETDANLRYLNIHILRLYVPCCKDCPPPCLSSSTRVKQMVFTSLIYLCIVGLPYWIFFICKPRVFFKAFPINVGQFLYLLEVWRFKQRLQLTLKHIQFSLEQIIREKMRTFT